MSPPSGMRRTGSVPMQTTMRTAAVRSGDAILPGRTGAAEWTAARRPRLRLDLAPNLAVRVGSAVHVDVEVPVFECLVVGVLELGARPYRPAIFTILREGHDDRAICPRRGHVNVGGRAFDAGGRNLAADRLVGRDGNRPAPGGGGRHGGDFLATAERHPGPTRRASAPST